MSMEIIWTEKEKTLPTFDDVKVGELFTIKQTLGLFMKIEDVYPRADLDSEVDGEHNLYNSDEIETDFFNAIKLSSGELRFFDSFDSITPVDTTIQVCSKN